ncbi:MAG: PHB depolymerase family esterase [Nevskia sp.]|nr:PHB depolymerase family esterase [Nevskia sp.]
MQLKPKFLSALQTLGIAVLALLAQAWLMPSVAKASRFQPVNGVTTFEAEFTVGGRSRRVLYLRPVANPTGLAPAIVVLHYAGGNSEEMANLIELGQLVRDTGVWAILPNSRGRNWAFDPVRDRSGLDDVGLITRIIDNAVAAYPIDARRVYMTGFSSGGFMTQRYVCEHPERVAAAAYVSSTLLDSLRKVCKPSLPTPIIGMHGNRDAKVSYKKRLGLSSAPGTALFFARLNRCLTPPLRSKLPNLANDGTTVLLDSYDSCASPQPVRFYTIDGGGHTWPGNHYQLGFTGRTSQDIDATRVIWNFVRNYSR